MPTIRTRHKFYWAILILILFFVFYPKPLTEHFHKNSPKKPQTDPSLSDPSSLWVVVNKIRPLNPKSYEPKNLVFPNVPLRLGKDSEEMKLRNDAAKALEKLVTEAKKSSVELKLASGYRSYNSQVNLYDYYVQNQGQSIADSQSARPGFSEHQTGLAADIEPASGQCEVQSCFADLAEGKWLAAHANKFGFIIRYQKDTKNVVGYEYEPWHIRYVGADLAGKIHSKNNIPLESYFNLPAAPNYK